VFGVGFRVDLIDVEILDETLFEEVCERAAVVQHLLDVVRLTRVAVDFRV